MRLGCANHELEPGADEAAGAADDTEVVGAVGEVALVDFGGAEVFEVVEGGEFGGDLRGGEEELEGFAGEVDAGGEGIVGELLARG